MVKRQSFANKKVFKKSLLIIWNECFISLNLQRFSWGVSPVETIKRIKLNK